MVRPIRKPLVSTSQPCLAQTMTLTSTLFRLLILFVHLLCPSARHGARHWVDKGRKHGDSPLRTLTGGYGRQRSKQAEARSLGLAAVTMTVTTSVCLSISSTLCPGPESLTCVSPPGTHNNPRDRTVSGLREERAPRAGGSKGFPGATKHQVGSQFLNPALLNVSPHASPGPLCLRTVLLREESLLPAWIYSGLSPSPTPRDRLFGSVCVNVHTHPHACDVMAPKGRRPQRPPNATFTKVQGTQEILSYTLYF